MREVIYSAAAAKVLRRMPTTHEHRIRAKVDQYANDPASLGNNVKALKGLRSSDFVSGTGGW